MSGDNEQIKKIAQLSILPILGGILASFAVWTTRAGNVVTSFHTGWGDLLLHIRAAIFFATQGGIPTESFVLSGKPVGYAYIADYISGVLFSLNIPIGLSFLIPTVILTMISLFLFQYIVLRFTNSQTTAILATILFFGFGSLGGFYTFPELFEGEASWSENLANLPHDVTFWPDQGMRIPNPFVILMHQRAYLVGLPVLFLLMLFVWKALVKDDMRALGWAIPTGIFLAFSHPYTWGASLLLLPPWVAIMWLTRQRAFSKEDAIRFVGAFTLIAIGGFFVVKLLQPNAGASVIAWQPGWMDPGLAWPLFWINNIGAHLFLIPFSWFFLRKENKPMAALVLASLVPFTAANLFKFAPWEWDNTKVFTLVWIVFSIANAHLLVSWFKRSNLFHVLATITICIMVFTGGLEILRAIVRYEEPYVLVSNEAIAAGEELRSLIKKDDVIVSNSNADHPIYITSGRPHLVAYEGWLWSGGWRGQYEDRAAALPVIYSGGPRAEELIDRYGITLVTVGPAELKKGVNIPWFESLYEKIPLTQGKYTVYRVRP